jgi:signal transduction histidine kinase
MPVEEETPAMKVQREQFQGEQSADKEIQALQSQIDALTAENMVLQEQLARKEQFTAMIAHELRSPLSPIISYAQMILHQINAPRQGKDEETNNLALQRKVNVIISQGKRMSRLVNDLLDASRLSSGQFSLLRESCNLVILARDMVEQLRPVAPYHNLVVEVVQEPVMGNWDSGRLQQALGNLLDNAIKYSDERTTVTVRVGTVENKAYISVHNQGASIPSSDIGLLFRPYMRLAASNSREGSGLGLYITKSIIEAHGGTLYLEPPSEETGSVGSTGTTFTFNLPLES